MKKEKSLAKTKVRITTPSSLWLQVDENRTKIFESIAVLLVVGCLVTVAAATIFIALVGIFWLFWLF